MPSGPEARTNLVEPVALVDDWLAHPPQGFRIVDAGWPAFVAPLDLLTTLDARWRRRLRASPGHRWWGAALRWRTAFVGCTSTEYLPLPRTEPEAWPALVRRWRQTLGRGVRLVVVKDLPQASPLLDDADNAAAEALARALADDGWLPLEGQALAYVPIDFADIDAYLQRLSRGRRRDLRRKLRSRSRLDIRPVPTGAAYAGDDRVDALVALYRNVLAQSELHFDELTRDYLAALLRDEASGGIVFEYRTADDGALIGWNLCYRQDGRLVDKYVGFAYPQARELDLYFVSWFVNLEHALAQRCTHYVAGWTDPEVKAQLGARFTFTRHAVWICNPVLRRLLAPLRPLFEGDRRALEALP